MNISNLLGSRATQSLEQVMAFARDRHTVLTDNIANISTPHYRANDLQVKRFNKTLERALKRSRRQSPNISILDLPSVEQLKRSSTHWLDAADLRNIIFHDNNDRFVEKLGTEQYKNASRHAEALNLLRTQVRLLRAIIAESAAT